MTGLSDYAGRLYAQPGVQPLLLELQDEAGEDVLLLLTACWLGQRQVRADAALWQALRASQVRWQVQVITPLRQVRRALADDAAARHLYEQVKACELASEWHQLGVLEQLCQPVVASVAAPASCMLAHLRLGSENPDDNRIRHLATAALGSRNADA